MSETRYAENFYQKPNPIITLKLKSIFREIRQRNTVGNTGEKYGRSNTARNTVGNGMSETISAENFCQNPIPIKTLKLKTIFQEIQRSEIQLEIQVRNTEEVIQIEIQLEMV